MAKKEAKEHEEKMESMEDMEGALDDAGAPVDDSAGLGPDHDDAAQDVALIKKMIDEYLGASSDSQDEGQGPVPPKAPPVATGKQAPPAADQQQHEAYGVMEEHKQALTGMTQEALEAYKEMGYSKEEAMKCAEHAMKLAHHMAMKQMKASAEAEEAAGGAPADPSEADIMPPAPKAAPGPDKSAPGKTGPVEAELIQLKGKIALMEAAARKAELAKYVDKKLAESKLPKSITKAFREAAGDIKSKQDFDVKWKLFTANVPQESEGLSFAFTEKAMGLDENMTEGQGLSFNSIVKEDEI